MNRRTGVLAEQAAALAGRAPDIVALQEITARSADLWRAALATIGLPHTGVSTTSSCPSSSSRSYWRGGGLSDHSAIEVDIELRH